VLPWLIGVGVSHGAAQWKIPAVCVDYDVARGAPDGEDTVAVVELVATADEVDGKPRSRRLFAALAMLGIEPSGLKSSSCCR
jgi:hypothetical protein